MILSDLLTVEEVIDSIGVSYQTLNKYCKMDILKPIYINEQRFFSLEQVENYKEYNKIKAFYIVEKEVEKDKYGVLDVNDGVVEYFTYDEIISYSKKFDIRGLFKHTDGSIEVLTFNIPVGTKKSSGLLNLGSVKKMKNNQYAIVIEWIGFVKGKNYYDSCKIMFEDNTIVETRYRDFKLGCTKNPNHFKHLHEKKLMQNGLYAEVIDWNYNGSRNNCRIRFEDGYERDCEYSRFNKGYVSHPIYRKAELKYKGMIKQMRNGQYAEVIDYIKGSPPILKIRFEDGYERECGADCYLKGSVKNPDFTDYRSLPEKIVAYFIGKYYSYISSYKPEWLRFPSGNLGEIDIWIPKLNIGIEYDGFAYHCSIVCYKRDMTKNQLVEQSSEIKKLIRLREYGCPCFTDNSCKVSSIQAKGYINAYEGFGIELLENVIEKLLDDLGVLHEKVVITREIIDLCYKVNFEKYAKTLQLY